jgi:hypothetical protein
MTQIINTIIYNFVYNFVYAVYIGSLVFAFCYAICKPVVDKINNTTDDLTRKQDILHQAIIKIRNIIRIDDDLSSDQTNQLKKIRDEITTIKKILSCNRLNDLSDNDTPVSESETIESEGCKSPTPLHLHIQNHVTFPHFFIFNEQNFKQTKISNYETEFKFIGDDLRLISYQLAAFQEIKPGTCMSFDEAFKYVFMYVQRNKITNIAEDPQLCKLFGLNENEDYEQNDANLIKLLKKMLEPHFRKITYQCDFGK